MATIRDTFGLPILLTDRVRVTSYGDGARMSDCGLARPIRALNKTRVVILDADGRERAVSGRNLGILRRDGGDGYEGNVAR